MVDQMVPDRVFVTGGSGFIGTALLVELAEAGRTVLNFDLAPLELAVRGVRSVRGDILDAAAVADAVADFRPDAVVHLAARTDTLSDDVTGYRLNTDGTMHVLEAANRTDSVQRVVHTSTQYVAAPGTDVSDPLRFAPFTAYGESKARSEMLVREHAERPWTIVRPSNIWGPRHPRYPVEFWRVLQRGLYVHPDGPPVVRTYGYVDNVAAQYRAILDAPLEQVRDRVFYLGDAPIDIAEWVDAFSIALRGRPARRVPLAALKAIALAGDVAKRAGYRSPPLSSSRLHSMTEDYVVPTASTIEELGMPGLSLQAGVDRTVEWLRAR